MEAVEFHDLLNSILERFKGAPQGELELFCQKLSEMHKSSPARGEESGGLDDADVAAISVRAVKMLPKLEAHELAMLAAGSLGAALRAQFQTSDLSKHLGKLEAPPITNPSQVMTQLRDERKWIATLDDKGSGHRKFQLTPLGIVELRSLCFRCLEHERLQRDA